jgi:hypothetical protein
VEEAEGGEVGTEGVKLGPAGIDQMAMEHGDEVEVLAAWWRDRAVRNGEGGRVRDGGGGRKGGEVSDERQ